MVRVADAVEGSKYVRTDRSDKSRIQSIYAAETGDGKVSGIRSVALEEIPEKHELISALAVSGISGKPGF